MDRCARHITGPTGGRFDIGPEFQTHRNVCQPNEPNKIAGNHHNLWLGSWTVSGDGGGGVGGGGGGGSDEASVTLVSVEDEATRPVQLTRNPFNPLGAKAVITYNLDGLSLTPADMQVVDDTVHQKAAIEANLYTERRFNRA